MAREVRHDLDVETGQVVVLQIALDLLDELDIVRPVFVEPEHRRRVG
jgi:hypothetical protein